MPSTRVASYLILQVHDKAGGNLSTSRSMPSLGTSRQLQGLKSGQEKDSERKSSGASASSTELLAERVDDTPTVRSVASDSYITSTQMAYMTGGHILFMSNSGGV